MSLILVAVCAVFAAPILLVVALVVGLELAWAIVSLPFRLAYASARASKNAALWIARRLAVWGAWLG